MECNCKALNLLKTLGFTKSAIIHAQKRLIKLKSMENLLASLTNLNLITFNLLRFARSNIQLNFRQSTFYIKFQFKNDSNINKCMGEILTKYT